MLDPVNNSNSLISEDVMKTILKRSVQKSKASAASARADFDADYSSSDLNSSIDYARQYKGYGDIKNSLLSNRDSLRAAQTSFKVIRDNVDTIKSLVKKVKSKEITGSGLVDAQKQIDDLVTQIKSVVETTTINGKKVFDGNYTQTLSDSLENVPGLTVDFTRSSDKSGNPTTRRTFEVPAEYRQENMGFQVMYSDEKYVVATATRHKDGKTC